MKLRIFAAVVFLAATTFLAGDLSGESTAVADDFSLVLRPIRGAQKKSVVPAAPAKARATSYAFGHADRPQPKVSAKIASPPRLPQQMIQKVELVAANAPETTLAETTGLVVEHNYVVVPFDVIASFALHRGEPAFFIGAQRIHATLSDFDLISNQALLRTDTSFTESVSLGSLREQWPRVGESITTAQGTGAQKFTGKIHDVTNDGILNRFSVPSPFSAQNVESFAFDQNGSFVGLRSREQDDFSPATYTRQMVNRLFQKQPASTQSLFVKLHQQWTELQTKWTQSLIQDKVRLRMQQWQVGLGTRLLKCEPLHARIADRELASIVNRAEGQNCVNRASTKVDADYKPGVETVSGVGSLRGAVDGDKWKALTQQMARSFFSPFDSDIEAVSLFSAPVCEESTARSRSGQELRVHYCTSAIKNEGGLNDSVFFVTTRQPATDEFAFSGIRLKGFDQANSKALVWSVMESFKRLK